MLCLSVIVIGKRLVIMTSFRYWLLFQESPLFCFSLILGLQKRDGQLCIYTL